MSIEKIKENRREQDNTIENLSLSDHMKNYKNEQEKRYNEITKELHSINNSPNIAGRAALSILAIGAGSAFISGGLSIPIVLGTIAGFGITGGIASAEESGKGMRKDDLNHQKRYLTETMERENKLDNLELSSDFKEYRNNQDKGYEKAANSIRNKVNNLDSLSSFGLASGLVAGFVGAVTVSAVSSVAIPIAVGCLAVSGVSYLASKKVEKRGAEELKEIEKNILERGKKFEEEFSKSEVSQKADKYEPPKSPKQEETKRDRVFFDLNKELENNIDSTIKAKSSNSLGKRATI